MKDLHEESSSEMTFFEHIDALRPHLMRSVAAVFVIMVAAFCCKGFIIDTILFGPQSPDFPTNRLIVWINSRLGDLYGWINGWAGTSLSAGSDPTGLSGLEFHTINTYMAGQFNLHMKVSLVVALALGMPYFLWELWQFVRPALTSREIAGTRMFVLWVSVCFFTGLLFGYFIMAPLSVNFFIGYQASAAITNMIDVGDYFSTVIIVSLACAVMFQLPLLIYYLTRMGLVSSAFLRKYRRHAVVLLMVLAAIITPPDIFSLLLVSVPLCCLYELSIRFSSGVERRQALREQEHLRDMALREKARNEAGAEQKQ